MSRPNAESRCCAHCKADFVPHRNHPNAIACSDKCRGRMAYEKRKSAASDRDCERCKVRFSPGYPGAKFCSRQCAGSHIADARISEKSCGRCGEKFVSKSRHRTCGACGQKNRLDRVHARNKERRHLRRGALGLAHSTHDWLRLLARFRGLCAYCGDRAAQHKDHVLPICRGGKDSIGNILPACAPCNLSKGGSLLIEWKRRLSNARKKTKADGSSSN
jgi:hypothetical protein